MYENETDTTVIDGFYQLLKQYKVNIKTIKSQLNKEEYDSDSLSLDLLNDDKDDSNISTLLVHKRHTYNQYKSIQSYMRQNVKGLFYFNFIQWYFNVSLLLRKCFDAYSNAKVDEEEWYDTDAGSESIFECTWFYV